MCLDIVTRMAEAWTLSKYLRFSIEAFEMQCYRRSMKISCMKRCWNVLIGKANQTVVPEYFKDDSAIFDPAPPKTSWTDRHQNLSGWLRRGHLTLCKMWLYRSLWSVSVCWDTVVWHGLMRRFDQLLLVIIWSKNLTNDCAPTERSWLLVNVVINQVSWPCRSVCAVNWLNFVE